MKDWFQRKEECIELNNNEKNSEEWRMAEMWKFVEKRGKRWMKEMDDVQKLSEKSCCKLTSGFGVFPGWTFNSHSKSIGIVTVGCIKSFCRSCWRQGVSRVTVGRNGLKKITIWIHDRNSHKRKISARVKDSSLLLTSTRSSDSTKLSERGKN